MNPGGRKTSFEDVEDNLKKWSDLESAPVATQNRQGIKDGIVLNETMVVEFFYISIKLI
jgi:hypothetical protein